MGSIKTPRLPSGAAVVFWASTDFSTFGFALKNCLLAQSACFSPEKILNILQVYLRFFQAPKLRILRNYAIFTCKPNVEKSVI